MRVMNGIIQPSKSTIFVRYMSDAALEFDSKPFTNVARENHLFYVEPLGRGQIGLISADSTYKLIQQTLQKRPWFLTKAELMGVLHPKIVPE